MEDPVGFMRYPREDAGKQFARARIRHWHEYEEVVPVIQATLQARRCMDCGTPYCHSYCPAHNLIPEWNGLVNDEDWRAACEQLESTNNFPEFTGRICSVPCEPACTLSIRSHPLTIRSIELAIIERAWQAGWIKPRHNRNKLFRRVAIIGSGPAGLACAQQLVRAGYRNGMRQITTMKAVNISGPSILSGFKAGFKAGLKGRSGMLTLSCCRITLGETR